MYYHDERGVYANVYCFLCNNPTFTNGTICNTSNFVKKLPLSFAYLIDVRTLAGVPDLDGSESSRCADGDIFDNYFVSVHIFVIIVNPFIERYPELLSGNALSKIGPMLLAIEAR